MSASVEAKDPWMHAGFGEFLKVTDCPCVCFGFFWLASFFNRRQLEDPYKEILVFP